MRLIAFGAACMVCWASGVQAADLVSGTWTSGDGAATRVYVFKVSGDRLTGIVCGPCDDPASVFRIEDGRMLGEDRATFFIRYDAGGRRPAATAYRERVDASLARNAMKLSTRPEPDSGAATTSISLKRVVENFELGPQPLPAAPAGSAKPPAASDRGTLGVGRAHGATELDPQGSRQRGVGTRVRTVHAHGGDDDRRAHRGRHHHVLHQPYRHAAKPQSQRHPAQRHDRHDHGTGTTPTS